MTFSVFSRRALVSALKSKWSRHIPAYATEAEAELTALRCHEVARGWEIVVRPTNLPPKR